MTLDIPFDNSYGRLPDRFYVRQPPTPVSQPEFIAINEQLAQELGLDVAALKSPEGLDMFAGNAVPDGADPLAQAYSGHQFGGWSPELGDGRALLIGEILDTNGLRRDIQLKGSGPTPFSRRGDGRSALGPVVREYLVSEAMHALGIPTTRALAAVTTGDRVQRETGQPGGILTRVASSHIRVGTFQFFASRQDVEGLKALTDHVINRHYPDVSTPLELLDRVIQAQAELIAKWMGVGFIHGVMNTDNSHIGGITIDYGPCAFLDAYDPGKVFSSIDQMGRYAFARQPDMAVWNMAQFATALLPLIDDNQEVAVESATKSVHRFPKLFADAWLNIFRRKIGLTTAEDGDSGLIEDLLQDMKDRNADFTNTFRSLSVDPYPNPDWHKQWLARRNREPATTDQQITLMNATNPAVIPRNHRIEKAIQAAVSGDYAPFFKLNQVLSTPFGLADSDRHFSTPPTETEEIRQTFCGT